MSESKTRTSSHCRDAIVSQFADPLRSVHVLTDQSIPFDCLSHLSLWFRFITGAENKTVKHWSLIDLEMISAYYKEYFKWWVDIHASLHMQAIGNQAWRHAIHDTWTPAFSSHVHADIQYQRQFMHAFYSTIYDYKASSTSILPKNECNSHEPWRNYAHGRKTVKLSSYHIVPWPTPTLHSSKTLFLELFQLVPWTSS